MGPGLGTLAVRLLGFVVTIVVIFTACRLRRLPIRPTLALNWPGWRKALLWFGLFALLAVAEEVASRVFGIEPSPPWSYPPVESALRILGILLLAPVAEELLFRGLLFTRIRGTRLGSAGAILITSLLFAALHLQYDLAGQAMVLTDGLFFALTRDRTESTPLTILLHASGNLVAILQRMS